MSLTHHSFSTWPHFDNEQIKAVSEVLQSGKVNYWTGEHGRLFEQEYAKFFGCRYGVAVANGTVALELALHALDIGIGDDVITTSRTFIASASCIVIRGANPIFADIDKNSQNITLDSIKKVITPKTKAIIAVHLAGWPCEMDDIITFAKENDIKIIEDCAQAHGAQYKNKPVGSMGHIGAFSFCQDKIMTTGGEGGMVITNDEALWSRMWSYKDHGKSWHTIHNQTPQTGFKWLHESFGTNWRMTEIQAVLGRLQLHHLSTWSKQRLTNAKKIWGAAAQCKALRVPLIPDYIQHAAYKCYVFVSIDALKPNWDRDRIVTEINSQGISCFSGSCSEIYLEKAFSAIQETPQPRLPVAKKLGEISLMFLVHPTLTDNEIKKTCDAIQCVMKEATK